MHSDPKIAFEFLARRYPDEWGEVARVERAMSDVNSPSVLAVGRRRGFARLAGQECVVRWIHFLGRHLMLPAAYSDRDHLDSLSHFQ